jgi:site-specific DNA recombinase
MDNNVGTERITYFFVGLRPVMVSVLQFSLRRTLMRIALYLRVSTTNQRQAQTIEQQLDQLQHALQERQWAVAQEHIFRDDGLSGASLNRPGLDRLRDCVRNRELDVVLITAPDRLSRHYIHQMVLLEEFERGGCRVEFLERPMSQDPHDQLVLQIRSAVAEYERTLITERMRRGRLMKLRAGTLLPWTHPLYGYRVHPDRPRDPSGVTLDPTEAALVAELFAQYLEQGMSLHQLSRFLHERGIPSPTNKPWWGLATIRGLLTNPTYTGALYSRRMRYRTPQIRRSATHPLGRPHETGIPLPPEEWIPVAQVPAIVSLEQFERVQAKLAHNQSFAQRHNTAHHYLLRALVSCGRCLRACTARTAGKYGYYLCSGKAKPMHRSTERPCEARFIPAAQLDEVVWKDLCEVLTHPDQICLALERAHGGHWLPQELQSRREHLRKARHHLGQQRDRLTDAYLQDIIPLAEYERRRRDLEQKMEAIGQMEAQLLAQAHNQEQVAQLALSMTAFCQRVQQGLAQVTWEQKRQLVELVIDRVVVTDDHVEIRYVIPTAPASEHVRF